jgi:hypothetical protein
MRLTTLGVGAMNSPRYAPAGLLVAHAGVRAMLDGGPGAEPLGRLDVWLVTDERSELIARIRRSAARRGLAPRAASFRRGGLVIERLPVVHTSHPAYGYRVRAHGRTVVWAPEFYRFPAWARGADLMFADGAAWNRPIRFAGGVGGHADVLTTAAAARLAGVRRLVFAHIGRPTLRALSRGATPSFGSFAVDGQRFVVARSSRRRG